MTTLTFDIAPVAWERARVGRFGHFTAPKSRRFKHALQTMMRAQWTGAPLATPIRARMTFYVGCPKRKVRELPSVKPDIDNFQKQVMDCGNGIVWSDDALIVHVEALKLYSWADRRTRIVLEITELPDGRMEE